jgi:hypothetical protein
MVTIHQKLFYVIEVYPGGLPVLQRPIQPIRRRCNEGESF